MGCCCRREVTDDGDGSANGDEDEAGAVAVAVDEVWGAYGPFDVEEDEEGDGDDGGREEENEGVDGNGVSDEPCGSTISISCIAVVDVTGSVGTGIEVEVVGVLGVLDFLEALVLGETGCTFTQFWPYLIRIK